MNTFLAGLLDYLKTQGLSRALRHRDFALFSATSWFSTTGMWMQRLGVGWLTWDMTHSGAWLGIMAAAQAMPGVFLLPFTGAFADRIDRLKLMRVTQAITFFSNLALAVLTLTDHITVVLMLGLTLISGIVQTFNMPARMTIAPSLVPRADLPAAISVNSFLFTTAMFVGPGLAGVLMAHGGVGLAFAANAASYFPFYVMLYIIKLPPRSHRPNADTSIMADVIDGLRYVWRHPGIGPVLGSTLLLSILVRPLADLVPGFIGDVFQAGPKQLGFAMSAYGLGGMAGSFWMGNRGKLEGSTTIYIVFGLILTSFTMLFASVTMIMPAVVLMAVLGFSNSVSNNAAQSLIQGSVAPSHRGRVISLYSLNGRAGPSFGAMLIGWMSHSFGLQIPVGVAGLLGVGVMFWVIKRKGEIVTASEVLADEDDEPLPVSAAKAAE